MSKRPDKRQRSYTAYDSRFYTEEYMPRREAQVSREIASALRHMGWRVYNFASKKSLPAAVAGFPDLVAFRPGLPVFFIQVKAEQGGRLSDEQREFAEIVTADTGAIYVQASSLDDVLDKLRTMGAIMI